MLICKAPYNLKLSQCGLVVYWSICQTLGTGGDTILGSVLVGGVVEHMSDSWYWWCYLTDCQCGWWCSGVHNIIRLFVLVVLGPTVQRVSASCRCSEV